MIDKIDKRIKLLYRKQNVLFLAEITRILIYFVVNYLVSTTAS